MKDYCITRGDGFRLHDIDPDDTGPFKSKEEADDAIQKDLKKISDLHDRFYVDRRRALLIILQGMDTSGKDSTVKHVFSGVNPIGCQVTSFKAPSEEELGHSFLWRITNALPRKGDFGIFNRSHYEDVLVVRVHNFVPKTVWDKRYKRINHFEKLLADEDTLIVKFFLHISKDEQKRRLLERLEDPAKQWKLDPKDISERQHWDEYMKAYQDVIRRCTTSWAPWHVVPANKKWYRNYVVANTIVKMLSKLDLEPPKPKYDPSKIKIV